MSDDKGHILILGAGLMQKPAVENARSLGLTVSLVDGNPNAVCVPFADFFEPIDLKDKEAILSFAKKMKQTKGLSGVFTAGTDFSAVVSYVAQECYFHAHSYESALNASDKIRMRRCFKEFGVSSPHFLQADLENLETICLTADRLGEHLFPLVVKPVDNMGGRGCRLVRRRCDLEEALSVAIKNSRTGRAIVEDYMEGPEFSIDAIIYKGTVTICGFADRHIFFPPYFIEMGHTMPTCIDNENRFALISTFVKGIKALGLTCGVAKADMKLTKKGPMVGEIAARLSGGYMSGWTYPYSSDCPLTQQAELIAVGKEPAWLLENRRKIECAETDLPLELFEIPSKRTSAERAWISIPGQVSSVIGLERASDVENVNDVMPRALKGDVVVFPRNNVEKCGNVISTAQERNLAMDCAQQAVSKIVLRLEPNNSSTNEYFWKKTSAFPPDAFNLSPSKLQTLLCECEGLPKISLPNKIKENIPNCLLPVFDTLKDWNYRTLRQTLDLYNSMDFAKNIPSNENIDGFQISPKIFWHACIRGGIQGLLYVTDCVLSGVPVDSWQEVLT